MTEHPIDHRKYWLASQINKYQFKVGAELGVQRGVTHLWLLQSCPQLTLIGVDTYQHRLPDKQPILNQYYVDLMSQLQELYADRSVFFKESTLTAHSHIATHALDFIFIDADHSYQGVKADLFNWVPKVRRGGFVIGHDYNNPRVAKAVDEFFDVVKTGPDNIWYFINE